MDIILLNTGSGAAALSTDQTVDLTADTEVNQHVVTYVHGKTYHFQADTGAIDPPGKFDWIRTPDVNTDGGTVVQNGALPTQTIGCSPQVDSDTFTIANLDYDEWSNQKLRVDAANDFSVNSAWEHLVFDVDGKLKIVFATSHF